MNKPDEATTAPRSVFLCPRRDRRASILMVTIILLVVAGISIVALVQLTTQNVRDVSRAEHRLQAFYVAESGAQHVVDWFNRPAASPSSAYFSPNENNSYLDSERRTIITTTYEVPPQSLPRVQTGDASRETGRVVSLVVEPPHLDDPVGTVARVTSVGQTPRGIESTVEIRLMDNNVPAIVSPAAIVSRAGAGSSGLFAVNWGEIWTRGNLGLPHPLNQKFPNSRDDPWFGVRAEGHLVNRDPDIEGQYADGRVRGGFADTPIEEGAANYYIPYLWETLESNNRGRYRDYENLRQHQTLDWPGYDYETMKMLALYHDFPVYRTTADGRLITGYDAQGEAIVQTFEEVFNLAGTLNPDDVVPDDAPPMYFIDTIDGNPPREDGTNLATIRSTGNGPFFHGNFFMAANFYMGGSGNSPPLISPRKPDGTIGQRINNARLYGLLYSYGQMNLQGTGDVYGSLFAERGFDGGGSWEVFYDFRLQDERRNRVGSRVRVQLWNTY